MSAQTCIHAFTELDGKAFPGFVNVTDLGTEAQIIVRSPGHDGHHIGSLKLPHAELLALAEAIRAKLAIVPSR